MVCHMSHHLIAREKNIRQITHRLVCADASAILMHAYGRPDEDERDRRMLLLQWRCTMALAKAPFGVPAARKSVGNKQRQLVDSFRLPTSGSDYSDFLEGPFRVSFKIHSLSAARPMCLFREHSLTHARAFWIRGWLGTSEHRQYLGAERSFSQPASNKYTNDQPRTHRTKHTARFRAFPCVGEGRRDQRGRGDGPGRAEREGETDGRSVHKHAPGR